ncbi:putative bifunctional methylthioribulose-1-phosphate dehydratase/enolase-phosphatase E1 1 isoform X1 [Cucumis melo var. makuwa]|uniref:Bifunctional methylthioribulose-1-phosphate dehydratase/enolase-phosphatase E1 1 isoform X1 n=1 Tax=Cucumis melo var. makuwa TaxID=1194695 RepID=A0A5A7USH5_CUCMM|nr:putative bifunctional methylthioribulose-1-phosphate dehydratase/enolase-phosphatase E1 1 isoform X1 [Cucumis melo var. makuwa]
MAMASALPLSGVKLATTSQAYMETKAANDTKALLSELSRQFYTLRCVSGTGSSIAIKVHDHSIPRRQQLIAMSLSGGHLSILIFPLSVLVFPFNFLHFLAILLLSLLPIELIGSVCLLGVKKRRMVREDTYMLSSGGSILHSPPPKPFSHKLPNCFDSRPLFMKMRNAGAVIHSHSKESYLVTQRNHHQGQIGSIKGISSNISVKAGARGLDNKNQWFPRCIVLDIEGTTTPISFVTDVLFSYARDNVEKHLILTYETGETQDDIKLLRSQVEEDLEKGVAGAVPIPPDNAGKEEVIAAVVANVEGMIKADRKITALKQLQGHIWRTGFSGNELEGVVFDDVPEALERWHASGIKMYIYSSGSRLAQRLIFGKTNYGDLRKYLSGFFDTAVGNKRETSSYVEISESVGVDSPSEILFITDVCQEAKAAKAAGLQVAISIRPGNGPLPDNHGFQTITSFSEI